MPRPGHSPVPSPKLSPGPIPGSDLNLSVLQWTVSLTLTQTLAWKRLLQESCLRVRVRLRVRLTLRLPGRGSVLVATLRLRVRLRRRLEGEAWTQL